MRLLTIVIIEEDDSVKVHISNNGFDDTTDKETRSSKLIERVLEALAVKLKEESEEE